jgi:ACS family glucarate transporter-like MFS transporter
MTHSKWISATGGLVSRLIFSTAIATLSLVLVAMEESLGISHAEAGTITSMYGFFFIVGSLFWGYNSDRIGLRRSLTIASLMLALGIISMGTINSLAMGLLFYSIVGFAAAAPITLSAKLLGIWFRKTKRGVAQSYIATPSFLWEGVLGVLIPIIMLSFDWRAVWYILGGLSIFFSGLVFIFIRNNPSDQASTYDNSKINELKTTKPNPKLISNKPLGSTDVLKIGFTWHLGLILALYIFLIIPIVVFLVTYLITEVGLSQGEAGIVYSIFAIASIIGGYVLGFISDRISRKYLLTLINIMIAVFLLALISFGDYFLIINILVVGLGFAGGETIIISAIIADYFPLNVLGTASGVINGIGGVGSILGPLIFGYLATANNSFVPAFQMTALVAFVLAGLTLLLKKPNLTN